MVRSKNKISDYTLDFDIAKTDISNKRQVLRNCVNSELGLYVYECAIGQKEKNNEASKTAYNTPCMPLPQNALDLL